MHTFDNKSLVDKQSSLYLTFNQDDKDNYNYDSRHSIESSTIVNFDKSEITLFRH